MIDENTRRRIRAVGFARPPGVEKTARIAVPHDGDGTRSAARVRDRVGEHLPGRRIDDVDRLVLGAPRLRRKGHLRAVRRYGSRLDRGGRRAGPHRIEQDALCGTEPVAHDELRLRLRRRLSQIERATTHKGQAEALRRRLGEFSNPSLVDRIRGLRREIVERNGGLRGGEGAHAFTAGSSGFSSQRYGSGTAVPKYVSTTEPGADDGYRSSVAPDAPRRAIRARTLPQTRNGRSLMASRSQLRRRVTSAERPLLGYGEPGTHR